ncbi:hypothetical protein FJQ98_10545 [Lysinibacillus agricola]|uniref:Uncharacterized protein n=1 Tax=Lysinibacillus agricola TaxID=2590012 RepID=A0ABX7AX32_9BACI|nr:MULTISPECIES: hypothetical protein [Lysinibacillus]KOS63540.1 hypothetical protein AN161_07765 [Lysinibacillus sp. FJAT-14222]QQP14409.1 hypothetical protein FJQ98_10545 [Lysinibacillus agricola]
MTLSRSTNAVEINEEEIFKEALDIFIRMVDTKEDYLGLKEFLEKQTNYIPLITPNRGSYNAVWDVSTISNFFVPSLRT